MANMPKFDGGQISLDVIAGVHRSRLFIAILLTQIMRQQQQRFFFLSSNISEMRLSNSTFFWRGHQDPMGDFCDFSHLRSTDYSGIISIK